MTLSPTISTAYDQTRFDDNFPTGIEEHYWFRARTAVLDRALRDAERRGWIPRQASILEVGCGTGVVVAGLAARGHRIEGAELGTPSRLLVPERISTGLAAQDLPAELRAKIDVLMFCDVIEHVPDDVALLRETLAHMPKASAVVVTVPARPELWSDHDRYYGHFRRYTRRSLAAAFRAAGLEPVSTRYMFRSLYGAAGLIRLAGRQRDPVLRAPASAALHRVAAAVLEAEDRLLSGLPIPGLSVIGIGRRVG